jgi:Phage integrase family
MPPCAVGVPVAFSARAICARLWPVSRFARISSTSSGGGWPARSAWLLCLFPRWSSSLVVRGLSERDVTTPKSARACAPELFGPIAAELAELYLALGRPDPSTLVFGDAKGGHLRRQNWRQRVWIPALVTAGEAYFRPYDLRHTCATLLIYEGRPFTEVAAHMGHADPGFTARVYGHVFADAAKRRRVPIEAAIVNARTVRRAVQA